MLTFFRQLRNSLIESGSTRKYLLYAIGEILLVMVGILMALQVNNWNTDRKEKERETVMLMQLRSNLEDNINNLLNDMEIQIIGSKSIKLLIKHLDKKLAWQDSMGIHINNMDFVPEFTPASAAFETFKSNGFDIIHSDDLREEIINLYENTYPMVFLETRRLEDLLWPVTVVPLIQKYFRYFDSIPFPTNYEALIDDQEFINMLTYRLHFREQSTDVKESTVKDTRKVIEMIDEYLSE